MKWAHNRATELGNDCFFSKGETGRREKNWFAVNSWNFGTICGKEKNYELCAEFLTLVSVFHGDQFDGIMEEDNNVILCKSLILTVSSMIGDKSKFTLTDSEVKHAVELLQKAEKKPKKTISKIDPELLSMYTFNACDTYGMLDHLRPQQFMFVKRNVTSKACKPRHLLQLGLNASHGTRSNHEVATYVLNKCLPALLSSPSPDYQEIALILQRLIAVASIHKGDSDDDAVYNMYKQTYWIMVGLKEGSYQTEEGRWLVMTAWNRAALPVRMRQTELAMKWMNVSLDLASKVTGMETYKSCMEDFLAAFGDKIRSPKNH